MQSNCRNNYCHSCGKTFSRLYTFKRHTACAHEPRPMLRCDVRGCNTYFHRKDTLERHRNNQHGSSKVRCQRCSRLIWKDGLEQHHNTISCRSTGTDAYRYEYAEDSLSPPQPVKSPSDIKTKLEPLQPFSRERALANTICTAASSCSSETSNTLPLTPQYDSREPAYLAFSNKENGSLKAYVPQQWDAAHLREIFTQNTQKIDLPTVLWHPEFIPDSPRPSCSSETYDPVFYQEDFKLNEETFALLAIGPWRLGRSTTLARSSLLALETTTFSRRRAIQSSHSISSQISTPTQQCTAKSWQFRPLVHVPLLSLALVTTAVGSTWTLASICAPTRRCMLTGLSARRLLCSPSKLALAEINSKTALA